LVARGREPRPVELRLHPGDAGAPRFQPLELTRIADVVEPVLADLLSQPRRELRPELQVLGELGIQERGEPGILGIGRRGRRCGLRDGSGLRQRGGDAGERKPNCRTHSDSLRLAGA